jgi:hypothetical protein
MSIVDMQAIFDGCFSLVLAAYCIGLGIGLIVRVFKKAG